MIRSANQHLCVATLGLLLALLPMTACGGGAAAVTPAPLALSANDINLIFVVTPDLAHDPLGDINAKTADLNDRGLQRSLQMATYLKQRLLATRNVSGIYVLQPMSHPQTAAHYPDMAAIGFIQQFALLNLETVEGTTANSFPMFAAYAPGDVPSDVALPDPYVPPAQGLAFDDVNGNNLALAGRIIDGKLPGFYVFSAPWKTTNALLMAIRKAKSYNLEVPAIYRGPNTVYVVSITSAGDAKLHAFDSHLQPSNAYPALPGPVAGSACTQQTYFGYARTHGINGATIPEHINTNETAYLIRHAEAHPTKAFEDGNLVGAGQWRALSLPDVLPGALRGRGAPTAVYSIDPAQSFPVYNVSYVRPSLTVWPYAVAKNLPFHLAASFPMGTDVNSGPGAEAAYNFFFTDSAGVNLSNQTILLAWEHNHFPPLVEHLIASYAGTVPPPQLSWPSSDYDTIWTVHIDGAGNLTVDNALCQGIDSSKLPAAAPRF